MKRTSLAALAFVFGLRAKGRADGYHELPRPALL